MDGIALNVALVLLFVLIGGYFAASELALVSLRDGQVARLAGRSRRGERVARLREDPNRFLAAVQIGVTLAGFFSAAYGGSTLAEPLASVFSAWGMPGGLAGALALVVVTALISFFSLVLGELVPKRLALQRAEGVALFVAPVLDRIAAVFRPVIWLLSRTTDAVVRLLGLDPRAATEEVSQEELRDMVASHQELDEEEREVIDDVFDAADRRLREVMLPRTEVAFLSATTDLDAATRSIVGKPHSRYPVIGKDVDDVVGVVHVRDLLTTALTDRDAARGTRTVADVMRPVHALPDSRPMLGALSEMRARRVHLAVVIDEYGGTAGIVTLEDLIEEIVGDIDDEFDSPRGDPGPGAGARGDRRDDALLDGLLHRDDVRDRTGFTLPDGDFDTLGGYVIDTLGRIPEVGDSVPLRDTTLVVAEMDGRRVAAVRLDRAE